MGWWGSKCECGEGWWDDVWLWWVPTPANLPCTMSHTFPVLVASLDISIFKEFRLSTQHFLRITLHSAKLSRLNQKPCLTNATTTTTAAAASSKTRCYGITPHNTHHIRIHQPQSPPPQSRHFVAGAQITPDRHQSGAKLWGATLYTRAYQVGLHQRYPWAARKNRICARPRCPHSCRGSHQYGRDNTGNRVVVCRVGEGAGGGARWRGGKSCRPDR